MNGRICYSTRDDERTKLLKSPLYTIAGLYWNTSGAIGLGGGKLLGDSNFVATFFFVGKEETRKLMAAHVIPTYLLPVSI